MPKYDPYQALNQAIQQMNKNHASIGATGTVMYYSGSAGYSPYASQGVNQMVNKFNNGDEVVLVQAGIYDSSRPDNPVWGERGVYVSGIIYDQSGDGMTIGVDWKNGVRSVYALRDCNIELLSKAKAPKRKDQKIDFAHLDKVVMKPAVREEISAVLRQHQTSSIIFEQWGLGDVIEYGKGMTFMFYGPPGTGKTWAATCMAKALGMELLTVGASEIQSSEPGGANRAIDSAFQAATKDNKVLFIDECDGMIASRQGLGMILGSEINSLLTNIEKYEGVLVLATNMIENLDAALERRISLIVEFPEPDQEQRKAIWTKLLPEKLPLDKDVSIDKLSEYKLTGGQIKNAVLQAARLAVANITNDKDIKDVKVGKDHFESAIKRITASKNLMGTASRYYQHPAVDYIKKKA